jgi:hypothetical protein
MLFRDYVSKCYSMAQTDLEKDQVEIILKGKITKATQDGTISSKDWSQEPLPRYTQLAFLTFHNLQFKLCF